MRCARCGDRLRDGTTRSRRGGGETRQEHIVNALIGRELLATMDVDAGAQPGGVPHRAGGRGRAAPAVRGRLGARDRRRRTGPATMPGRRRRRGPAPEADVVKWIEVDVKARFVPTGVTFLDTPGTGVLYAAHAQMSPPVMPQADAVVFVLDSAQPVGQADLEFLDRTSASRPTSSSSRRRSTSTAPRKWEERRRRSEADSRRALGDRLAEDARLADLGSQPAARRVDSQKRGRRWSWAAAATASPRRRCTTSTPASWSSA